MSAEVDPASDVVTWRGRCPEAHREAYLTMRNQMNADVPTVSSTSLVMPEGRGHRLGAALKAVNYADLPERIGLVHTWTVPSNTAMHRTNTALGFRVVEHMHEMEEVL